MRKRTYVLNKFSNDRTAAFGKFNDDRTLLHTFSNKKSYLLGRKVSRKKNVKVETIQARKESTYSKDVTFFKKGQFIRLLIAFILLFIGLFFQYSESFSNSTSSIIYLLSILIGGYQLLVKSVQSLWTFRLDMRSLMIIPLLGVVLLGHFFEGAIFVILFSINELIELRTINLAQGSLKRFFSLAPKKAAVQVGDQFETVDLAKIDVDQIILVKAGEQIALDGIIISGETTVNEKIITGQSHHMDKAVGDEVFAGCLNEGEDIFVRVKKRVEETKLAHIMQLVKKAQRTKAPVQHFVENFITYYTPLVILLGFFIATLPPLIAGADWAEWIYYALAILVVACPCALMISTPIAFIAGLSHATNDGILIKSVATIEELSRIKGVVFDQIGTLTVGKPRITNVVSLIDDEDEFIRLAASISRNCNHPFSLAITHFAKTKYISLKHVFQFQTIAGKGSYGLIDGEMYAIGSENLLSENHLIDPQIRKQMEKFKREGKTLVTLSTSASLLGFFVLQDEIRPEIETTIQSLKKKRVKQLFLLTEDHHFAALHLAEKLGIEDDHIFPNLSADMKTVKINKLRTLFSHIALVSPNPRENATLSHDSVNIAMGTQINEKILEHADVIFLQENLTKLPRLIHLSKKTIQVVKNNISIVFLLKIAALLLVIPNLLTLWMAILVDIIATIIILINTLRLKIR